MSPLLSVRSLTVVVVVGLSLHAVFMGFRLVSFAIAEMSYGKAPDRAAQLEGWRDATGVAAAAREPSPGEAQKRPDAAKLEQTRSELEAYLTVRPLSPVKWLALAELDLSTGKPTAETLQALDMSHLTGPNEGYVMPRRALFGVLLWESLTPEQRYRVGRDIALADRTDDFRLKSLLRAKSAAARENIKFILLQLEGVTSSRLASIGLE